MSGSVFAREGVQLLFRDSGLDYPSFCGLDVDCFPAPSLTEKQFLQRRSGDFWTARTADNQLAGYLNASPQGERYHVELIMVAPQFRRQGLAGALLAQAEARAQALGFSRLFLRVREDNEPARLAYRHYGLRENGAQACRYKIALPALFLADAATLTIRCPAKEGGFAYPVEFFAQGVPVGSGHFNEEICGIKDFGFKDAKNNLFPALAALIPFCRLGAEALFVMTDDQQVIEACHRPEIKLWSRIYEMEKNIGGA